jgi:hypothetical protein
MVEMRRAIYICAIMIGICFTSSHAAAAATAPTTAPTTGPVVAMKVRFDYPVRIGSVVSEGADGVEIICKRLYEERYGPGPRKLSIRPDDVRRTGDKQALKISCYMPDARDFLDAVARHLEKLAAEAAQKPAEQAQAELQALQTELDELQRKSNAIFSITGTHEAVLRAAGEEKMKALEMEKQRLKMELGAKDARSDAVRHQMKILQKEVEEKISRDAVITQLQKVVELRKREMDSLGEKARERVKFEAAVAEAEAHVAERAEAVRQSANAELVNRLASEIALVAIDEAEMLARLTVVEKLLPPQDMSRLDEKALEALMETYITPSKGNPKLPPIYYEIQKRIAPLLERKLGLVIKNLEIHRES